MLHSDKIFNKEKIFQFSFDEKVVFYLTTFLNVNIFHDEIFWKIVKIKGILYA